jgi:ubiquinone/menaquinone biosynthesis C-methylase UbiE
MRLAILGLAVLCGAPPAAAAAQERIPAEPMSFRGADWLERAERDDEERPDVVLERMQIERGMTIADVGVGTGYYARRMAEAVGPEGLVYGVDIQQEMLDLLRRYNDDAGIGNVVPVLSTPDDPRLPAASIDRLLLADVYHEIANPTPVLRRIHAAMAPGGRVVLLEYRAEDATGDHIKSDHRMSVRQVLTEWGAEGFRLLELHEELPTQHMIVLVRADDALYENQGMVVADLLAPGADAAVEFRGGGDAKIEARVRNDGEQALVLLAPAGVAFATDNGDRTMIARRDVTVLAPAGESVEVEIAAVPGKWNTRAPRSGDRLFGTPPAEAVARILAVSQSGMFDTGSGRAYAPQTREIDAAAIWFALEGADWRDVEALLGQPRFPAVYAAGFALGIAATAGVDVTGLPVWRLRGEIFSRIQHEPLDAWFRNQR